MITSRLHHWFSNERGWGGGGGGEGEPPASLILQMCTTNISFCHTLITFFILRLENMSVNFSDMNLDYLHQKAKEIASGPGGSFIQVSE